MTLAETRLWRHVRGKQLGGVQFYRQRPIGSYIVDFYCPSAKLVVELDGGQHSNGIQKDRDRVRDAFLEDMGMKVTRFSDVDVIHNLEGVLHGILKELQK